MEDAPLIATRLRSHRLTAPAATPVAAARHMLAVQAQEFWGGRWALALRSRGEPTLRDVDRAFDQGRLVRSWTQRGTIHIVPAEDLGWMLSLTGERQFRLAAGRHRQLGLDDDVFAAAERVLREALRGGDRATRAEAFARWEAAGISTAGQRGVHLLQALSLRGVICQGPVVPRDGAVTREQFFVLTEDGIRAQATPSDPATELFVRFVDGHGPVTVRDFAWWSGLPLGACRDAAAGAGPRVRILEEDPEPLYAAPRAPRVVAGVPDVIALPAFDEYYLSYVDRGRVCALPHQSLVGPGANGMISPLVLAEGIVAGRWTHSRAVGRKDAARAELFGAPAVDPGAVDVALDRYAAFVAAS